MNPINLKSLAHASLGIATKGFATMVQHVVEHNSDTGGNLTLVKVVSAALAGTLAGMADVFADTETDPKLKQIFKYCREHTVLDYKANLVMSHYKPPKGPMS